MLHATLYRAHHADDDRCEGRHAVLTGNAIVTGGGTGVGRAAALALADAGWRVLVAGRRREALDAVCAEGGQALSAETCDVTDEASVTALFAAAANRFGRIDLLFNNAGVAAQPALVADVSLDDWQRVLATNTTGAFLCAREAFRYMARQDPKGGRIINNGSLSAQMPRPFSTAYTVSKHAVTGLTRMLSLEGRAHNIACGQIDIGNAATDMTRVMAMGVPQADGSLAAEPTIDAANVAASIVHMASLPLDANVQFMTVMATKMPFIGRG
jgi:NAD(P)-dependent dehydrogenase (short-subunit alcohol dehydrogenase family)